MDAHKLAGLIGLSIILPLWLLTSWRLAFHFTRGSAPPTQWWTLRRRFHVLLWCATISEAAAYADFAGLFAFFGHNISDKMAYILLDLAGRSMFEYLAFSSVTELWLQTALQASPNISIYLQSSLVVRSLNRVLGAVSVFLTGILAIYILLDEEELTRIEKTELLFRLQILIESLCWASGAAFVLMVFQITAERIQTSFATFPPHNAVERLALQCQALVPMGVCAFCYALRSIFLIFRMIGETPLFVATTRFHPIWWVAFVWAPTLLVVLCALYSARRRDRMATDTDDHHVPLLGYAIAPPAEAFQNFRRFADGIMSPFGPSSSSTKESATTSRRAAAEALETQTSMDAGSSAGLGDHTVV